MRTESGVLKEVSSRDAHLEGLMLTKIGSNHEKRTAVTFCAYEATREGLDDEISRVSQSRYSRSHQTSV